MHKALVVTAKGQGPEGGVRGGRLARLGRLCDFGPVMATKSL